MRILFNREKLLLLILGLLFVCVYCLACSEKLDCNYVSYNLTERYPLLSNKEDYTFSFEYPQCFSEIPQRPYVEDQKSKAYFTRQSVDTDHNASSNILVFIHNTRPPEYSSNVSANIDYIIEKYQQNEHVRDLFINNRSLIDIAGYAGECIEFSAKDMVDDDTFSYLGGFRAQAVFGNDVLRVEMNYLYSQYADDNIKAEIDKLRRYFYHIIDTLVIME